MATTIIKPLSVVFPMTGMLAGTPGTAPGPVPSPGTTTGSTTATTSGITATTEKADIPGVTHIHAGAEGITFTVGGGSTPQAVTLGGSGGPVSPGLAQPISFGDPGVEVVGLARAADQLIVLYREDGEQRFLTIPLAPGLGDLELAPAT